MAREGYLVHQGEETIHSDRFKRTPKTPKEKRENFWYYHKWHVLIGVVAVLFAAFLIHDALSKVEPDYEVGLITKAPVSGAVIQDMEQKLALGAKDRNGDKKVVVQVNNYAVGQDDHVDAQVLEANVTRLMGNFSAYSDMLFFCDDTGYAYLQKQNVWDASNSQMPMPKVLQYPGDHLTANMRVLHADSDPKYAEHKAYWNASKELYEKVKSGDHAVS